MIHEIIGSIFTWLQSMGEWGVLLGLILEVIPSEIILAYGGYLIFQGHASFMAVFLCGVIGGVAAQLIVYGIARYGGRPILEKYGKYILIKKHHIDQSEEWFQNYGVGVIFTARFVPVVRHAISIPAGISKMSVWKFTFLTTLAVIPWTIGFVYLGFTLGGQWEQIDEAAAPYVKSILLVALALLIGYIAVKFTISKKRTGKII